MNAEISYSSLSSPVRASSGRLLLPDILKGVAVLLMIQVHLTELFANQEFYDGFLGKVSLLLGGPPAAPVFMAVMGYFLAKSRSGAWQGVMRGFKLILYGFLLNCGLNLNLFYHIFIGGLSIDPLPYVFGVDILFLAGLSVIIISLLRPFFRNSLSGWLFIMIIAASARLFIPANAVNEPWITYLMAYISNEARWSYFPLFPWLAYPLAGYCFYLIYEPYSGVEIPKSKLLITGMALLLLLAVTIQYGLNITTDLQRYYHHSITYFLWTLLFLGLWVIAFYLIQKTLANNPVFTYLQWVGRNVTTFYVVQWLIIGNLATSIYKTVPAGFLLLWFLGVTIVTTVIVWIYRKLTLIRSVKKLN